MPEVPEAFRTARFGVLLGVKVCGRGFDANSGWGWRLFRLCII